MCTVNYTEKYAKPTPETRITPLISTYDMNCRKLYKTTSKQVHIYNSFVHSPRHILNRPWNEDTPLIRILKAIPPKKFSVYTRKGVRKHITSR